MDSLQVLKVLINDKAFSKSGTKALNKILDKAIERGQLYEDEKFAMQFIMGYEKNELQDRQKFIKEQQRILGDFHKNFSQKIAKALKIK